MPDEFSILNYPACVAMTTAGGQFSINFQMVQFLKIVNCKFYYNGYF